MKSNAKLGSTPASSTLDAWTQRHFDAGATPAWLLETLRGPARVNAAFAHVESELVATLDLLQELKADPETFDACILHTLQQCGVAIAGSAPAAAPQVRDLIEGQRAAEKVWSLYAARSAVGGAEGLRRLLLAIIRDLRVVFILLARQLVRMRAAVHEPGSDACGHAGRTRAPPRVTQSREKSAGSGGGRPRR